MAFLKNHTERLNMTCPPVSVPKNLVDCTAAILDSKTDSDSSLFFSNATWKFSHSAIKFFIDNYGSVILILLLGLFLYYVYKIYWDPICYVKELTQVGFDHIPRGPDRVERIARAQASRRRGAKIPPPYPNGWFALAESLELKVGGVLAVDALGQNFCVYRGKDGVARIVDAYCPHLGANLGVGGSVSGNCIECPFHKWKFDAEGLCVEVPGVDAPKGVSIKTWHTTEADGAIWVWHDAGGRAPLWRLDNAPECTQWGYRGKNEFVVGAHIQEIPENGADVAHLNAVHSPSMFTELGEKYPALYEIIGRHIWNASWTRNDDHTASMTLTHDYRVMNTNFFHTELKITQIGPGHVRLLMSTPIGPFLFSQSVTPLAPLLQRVTHRLYSPVYNALVAPALIFGEGKMIERDIVIWNSKRFVSAPTYVKTDKTIRAFRNWYSQFYTEDSPSYKDAVQKPLDW